MKRIYALLCVVALAVGAGWAQGVSDEMFDAGDNNIPRFGVRLAWELTSPSCTDYILGDKLGNGSGFAIGATYDIPLWKNLYFEPGLNIFYNTISYTPILMVSPEEGGNPFGVQGSGSVRNWGFSIPLYAMFRFDFTSDIKAAIFTGPKLNIGLSDKLHYTDPAYGTAKPSTHSANLYDRAYGWHRIDAQWMFGVRAYYQDNWYAEISGGAGMTNLFDTKSFDINGTNVGQLKAVRRNQFAIGVGYLF